MLLYWTLFAALLTVPCTLSRHLDHSESRSDTTVHDNLQRDDDENGWVLPRSHLRLHTKPRRVVQTTEGASEVLECQAGGSPLPHIYWRKNGHQIDLSDSLQTKLSSVDSLDRLDIGSTSSRLYLDCVTARDDAEYSCVAQNDRHWEEATTRVRVASSEDEDEGCLSKHGQAPRILTWTKTVLENQGQDIRVMCKVQGDPKPSVKWLNPREDVIEESAKYEMSSNGDLVIRNLKWKDMGNYICQAENVHGTARAEVFVYPATPET